MDLPIIRFNPKLKLSKNEQQVIDLLIEAAEMIGPLYLLQENRKFPGANFYPHDATKDEILAAAADNPDILSPYTVVERHKNKLIPIPYHIKYAKYLKPIVNKILEAAALTHDKKHAELLKIQADALLNGIFDKAQIARLEYNGQKININIGPMDKFDDTLFYTKTAYQAWVGVVDRETTQRFTVFKDLILSTRRKAMIPSERIETDKPVYIKVKDVFILSGLIARTKFVGITLPSNVNLIQEHGSEIVLFKQMNNLRVQDEIYPMYKEIFSLEFANNFGIEDILRGNIGYIALHEFAHSYLYYKHSAEHLQNFLPIIEELAATVLGMRVCGSLLLKDLVTTKELESMIIAFCCRSFILIERNKRGPSLSDYTIGGIIFINFMIDSGAIQIVNGMTIANFTKIFLSLNDLSIILESLLSGGTRADAEFFIKKYGKLNDFTPSPKIAYES